MVRSHGEINCNVGSPRSAKILLCALVFGLLALSACKTDAEADKVLSEGAAEFIAEQTGVDVAAGSKYAGAPDIHGDKCCRAAVAHPPSLPKTQAKCEGVVWDNAWPGVCHEKKGKQCITGLKTKVTVKEYSLQWDAERNRCVRTATGRDDTVETENCDLDFCGE